MESDVLDAPHTGARLETAASWAEPVKSPMPPTRGHDLKLLKLGVFGLDLWMPPTRGHDLKLPSSSNHLIYL